MSLPLGSEESQCSNQVTRFCWDDYEITLGLRVDGAHISIGYGLCNYEGEKCGAWTFPPDVWGSEGSTRARSSRENSWTAFDNLDEATPYNADSTHQMKITNPTEQADENRTRSADSAKG